MNRFFRGCEVLNQIKKGLRRREADLITHGGVRKPQELSLVEPIQIWGDGSRAFLKQPGESYQETIDGLNDEDVMDGVG